MKNSTACLNRCTVYKGAGSSKSAPRTSKAPPLFSCAWSRDDAEYQADIDRIYALLQLDRKVKDFDLSTDFLAVKKTQWTVRTRSISGLLYYLSQTVETPEQHQSEGLVTVTTSKTGEAFDWTDTPAGRRFKVRTQVERPDNAYIATYYRGHWFYIEDTDLESKSTFMLLRQLFDLQAGQTKSQGPTLTLPVR